MPQQFARDLIGGTETDGDIGDVADTVICRQDIDVLPFLLVNESGKDVVVGEDRDDRRLDLFDDLGQVRRKTVHLILVDDIGIFSRTDGGKL